MEPVPDRTSDTWEEFLARHKNTLWGCDFFSVKTIRRVSSSFCMCHLPIEPESHRNS